VQVRAGIDFEISERRGALIDALAVGKLARIGDALVVGDRELADAERDAPDRVASLVDLIDRVRQLRAELVAAHPKSADALRHQISRRS